MSKEKPEPVVCKRCGEVNPAEIHTCTPKQEEKPEPWQVIPESVGTKHLTDMKAKHIIERDGFVVGGYILDKGIEVCLVHHSAVRWMKYDQLFQILHVTTPPQQEWQGLTDEEISRAYNEVLSQPMREQDKPVVFNVCRAIEAKLKEKNSG